MSFFYRDESSSFKPFNLYLLYTRLTRTAQAYGWHMIVIQQDVTKGSQGWVERDSAGRYIFGNHTALHESTIHTVNAVLFLRLAALGSAAMLEIYNEAVKNFNSDVARGTRSYSNPESTLVAFLDNLYTLGLIGAGGDNLLDQARTLGASRLLTALPTPAPIHDAYPVISFPAPN
ncbi:hypothetical protein CALCODRAFT_70068 [Calocera cornea HHB12733]|uniref:Uncharacterized protein n=1 Tax=Calocera cornea HHB12733 TaxID=1353952 RepID=A0A165IQ90_9BASI|nr:hypothetical protein CALCODRAFT_70068 [Calocera cornea HHB12733]